jgi:hypothetical protein
MRVTTAALVLLLAGCATSEPPPDIVVETVPTVGSGVTAAPATPVRYEPVVYPADAALSVISAPFMVVFKGVVCAASAVVAAPTAALVSLSEPRLAGPTTSTLADGLASNCGPPYVLSPYRYVPVAAAVPPAGPPSSSPVEGAAPTPLM